MNIISSHENSVEYITQVYQHCKLINKYHMSNVCIYSLANIGYNYIKDYYIGSHNTVCTYVQFK